jgi:hypothetical protein
LFDPTLDQVSQIQPLSADRVDGDVGFELDGGKVLYRVVRADTTWQTGYNAEYARRGEMGRAIAQRALELEGFDENLV